MPYLKPLPNPTVANAPFWDGLREHKFLIPQCGNCGQFHWVPFPACKWCQSEDLSWVEASGDATVWSYSVVHRGAGGFDVPYIVVLAKLSEEPRPCLVLANLVDADPDSVMIGMPLKVVYEDIPEEDITMYRFAPATVN